MPEIADAQALLEIHEDPEVMQGLVRFTDEGKVTLTAPPVGIETARRNIDRMLRHWKRYDYGQWSVVEKASDQVIGCVGFFHRDDQPDVEIGWIIRRSHWGNGFASEAARAAVDWAWQNTAIDRIISVIRPDDARSIRVAEKSGQRFEHEQIEPLDQQRTSIYSIHRQACP